MHKLTLALALGVLLLPKLGMALGLGDIEVNSALNQELDADIELLSTTREEAEDMIIKMASRDAFTRAGLDRPYLLSTLKFRIITNERGLYIKVNSPKPIREPFLNFLIEVDWPKGHLLREYTILLDPPTFSGVQATTTSAPPAQTTQPAPTQQAPAPAQQTTAPVQQAPVAEPVQSTESSAIAPVTEPQQTEIAPPQTAPTPTTHQQFTYAPTDGYRVQDGDTAWSLANSMRPDESVSTEQMMLALLRANPEVFINQNINGIKRGYILRMPDSSEMTALTQAEAKQLALTHHALWSEYREALAGGEPTTSFESGEGTYDGIEAAEDSGDARLEIVSAGDGTSTAGLKDPTEMTEAELRAELAIAQEQLVSQDVQNEGLQERVDSMQNQMNAMQGVIEVEDSELADMQALAEGESEAEGVTEEIDDAEMLGEDDDLSGMIELESDIEAEVMTVDDMLAEDENMMDEDAVFIDETEGAIDELLPDENDLGSTETIPTSFTKEKETSIFDNILVLVAIGGGVLLVIVVGVLLVLRRRGGDKAQLAPEALAEAEADLDDVADIVDDMDILTEVSDQEVEEQMAAAESEAEKTVITEAEGSDTGEFDADATLILPEAQDTVVTPAAEPAEDSEEPRDDVIAEAEVYLAYGIFAQAEELLVGAIKDHPDRDGYKVKLAETHFAGKNAEAYTKMATDMKEAFAGREESSAWLKIIAMGKELCPEVEMFKEAGKVPGIDIDDLVPKQPADVEMDIDLGDSTESGADTGEIDLNFDAPAEEPAASDDSDLEFDISDTDAVESELDTKGDEGLSLDIGASELDLKEDAGGKAKAADDGGDLDFDLDMGDEGTAEKKFSPEDTGVIDISESEVDFDDAGDEPATETAVTDPDAIDLSGDIGDEDQINTKLDLAKAYLDMGDSEGAKSILDEVASEGNKEQKKEAGELLKQIDS